MRPLIGNRKLLFSLILLAFLQVVALGFRFGRENDPPAALPAIGDSLPAFSFRQLQNGRVPEVNIGGTVLLVFNSRCAHCAEVAPLWADWIRKDGSDWEVLAISSEEPLLAEAFARRHGWRVEVTAPDGSMDRRLRHAVTARTPWVYVLDSEGVVLSEGHGKQIAELTATIRDRDPGRAPGERPTE